MGSIFNEMYGLCPVLLALGLTVLQLLRLVPPSAPPWDIDLQLVFCRSLLSIVTSLHFPRVTVASSQMPRFMQASPQNRSCAFWFILVSLVSLTGLCLGLFTVVEG